MSDDHNRIKNILTHGKALFIGPRPANKRKVTVLLAAGILLSTLFAPAAVSESIKTFREIWLPTVLISGVADEIVKDLPSVQSTAPRTIGLPSDQLNINPFELVQSLESIGYKPSEALLALKLTEILGSSVVVGESENKAYLGELLKYQKTLYGQLSSVINTPDRLIEFAQGLDNGLSSEFKRLKNERKVPDALTYAQFKDDVGFSSETGNAQFIFTLAEELNASAQNANYSFQDFALQSLSWKDIRSQLEDQIKRMEFSVKSKEPPVSVSYQQLNTRLKGLNFYSVRLSPWLLRNRESIHQTLVAFDKIAEDMQQNLKTSPGNLGLNGKVALSVMSNAWEGAEGLTYQYSSTDKIRMSANLSAIPHEHFHAIGLQFNTSTESANWQSKLGDSFKRMTSEQALSIMNEQRHQWNEILREKGASEETRLDLSKSMVSQEDWDERVSLLRLETAMSKEEASLMVSIGSVLNESFNPNRKQDVSTWGLREKVNEVCQKYCGSNAKAWTDYAQEREESLATLYASQFSRVKNSHTEGTMDEMLMNPGPIETQILQPYWQEQLSVIQNKREGTSNVLKNELVINKLEKQAADNRSTFKFK